MSNINSLDKDNQYERNEFVVELIKENIDLMDQNIKLDYENKRLMKKVMDLQLDVKKLENLNREVGTITLMKDRPGYVVMLVKRHSEEYRM